MTDDTSTDVTANYFGTCPQCHETDGYANTGRSHWFYCRKHRTRWLVGANLFTVSETEEEQRAWYEAENFGAYETVEPYRDPEVQF